MPQALATIAVLASALVLHVKTQPFAHAYQNRLETALTASLVAFIAVAIALQFASDCKAPHATIAAFKWVMLINLIAPCIMVGVWLGASGGPRTEAQLSQMLLSDGTDQRRNDSRSP